MSIPICGSDNDTYFEKEVEDEWRVCVNYLNWLQKEKPYFHKRKEVMKKYWEDRLKALAPVIYKEKVGWLKDLEAKYPSGVDYVDYELYYKGGCINFQDKVVERIHYLQDDHIELRVSVTNKETLEELCEYVKVVQQEERDKYCK